MNNFALIIATFLSSWLLTKKFKQYAEQRELMDVPNSRSSHVLPTPRGGGVAIVITFLTAATFFYFLGEVPLKVLLPLLIGGTFITLIGFLDDLKSVPARWRAFVHLFVSAIALFFLFAHTQNPTILFWGFIVVSCLGLSWLLNLYNFMDGIDGLAAAEALFFSGVACLLLVLCQQTSLIWIFALLFASVAGFLIWNWSPARIFMGDAGSGFLGYTLGVLGLASSQLTPIPIWSWIILLGFFEVDATWTLLRRILRGERWYEAHRSHAYQHLTARWGSHKKTVLAMMTLNIVWLLPWSIIALRWPNFGALATFAALLPVLGFAIYFGAGS
jgi:Fuc2NAc and GlcNAc transferase